MRFFIPVAALLALAGPLQAETEADPFEFFRHEALLMDVEVESASRRESTLGQTPAAVFVITPEMIRRSGATVIPELLRMVPGMDVARIDGNKWAVSARGFNDRFANKLLVQIDGRTLYNPILSGVFWDTAAYPLEDIDRIEVIRGPGASLWGANAVNGVINIITRPANETQGSLLSGGGGGYGQGFGTARHGGRLRNGGHWRAYASGLTQGQQSSPEGNPNDAWREVNGGARFDWSAGPRDSLTLAGDFLRGASGRRDLRPLPASPFTRLNVEDVSSVLGNMRGRWRRQFAADSSWELSAYWDRVDLKGDNAFSDTRWDTFDVDSQREFPVGDRHHVVYGAGYRFVTVALRNSAQDAGFALTNPSSHRQTHLFTAFASDQISLLPDRLELTLGSKLEHNVFTGVEAQPSARVLWTPTPRQSFWAALSRAVRTPSLFDDETETTSLQTTPGVGSFPRIVGNTEFKSEKLLAAELGYRAQPADAFSADTALFFNAYDDLRVNVPGPAFTDDGALIIPLQRQNRMSAESYGVETMATWQPARSWRLQGAYAYLKMLLHADRSLPAATRLAAEAARGQSARNKATLRSSWDLRRGVELDLHGRFVDRLQGFNPAGAAGVADSVPAYAALDARLAWRPLPRLELEIVGENLLQSRHPEFGTSAAIRSFVVEFQRAVHGKATWRF